jgi:hypothetical protein
VRPKKIKFSWFLRINGLGELTHSEKWCFQAFKNWLGMVATTIIPATLEMEIRRIMV